MKWIKTFEKFDLEKTITRVGPPVPMKKLDREKPMPQTQKVSGQVIIIPNWNQY